MTTSCRMRLSDAANAVAAQLRGDDGEFDGVSSDSRSVQPGQLFVALKGPNFDAHEFVAQVAAAGASAFAICKTTALAFSVVPSFRMVWHRCFIAHLPALAALLEQARQIATEMLQDPEHALNTLSREELGLNPDDLGSPWGAALSSFVSFALGALVPLLPFVFGERSQPVPAIILLTGISLFCVGAVLSLFTGRGAMKGGLRMVLIGASAGAIAYLIGMLLGISLL